MTTNVKLSICSICLEQLKQPKTLTCYHRICLDCLRKLVYYSGEAEGIKCPECRTITYIPIHSVVDANIAYGSLEHSPSIPDNSEDMYSDGVGNFRNFEDSLSGGDNGDANSFVMRFRFRLDTIVREIYAVTKVFHAFNHRWDLSVHRDPDTSCLCANLILKTQGSRKFEFCEASVGMCVLNCKVVSDCLEITDNKTFIPRDFDLMYNWRTSLAWDVLADPIRGFVIPDGSFDFELSLKVIKTMWTN